jgi:hypothetical protein
MAETWTRSAPPGSMGMPRSWVREHELRTITSEQLPRSPRGRAHEAACIVVGCDAHQSARGLCKRHYSRWDWWRAGARRAYGSSLPQALQDQIIEMYSVRFMSGEAIAEELARQGHPMAMGTIYRCLRANNVRVRRRWWKGSPSLPQQVMATMIWLYEDCGWPVGRIAEWRGVSQATVSEQLKFNGAQMRPKSPWAHMREEWRRLHDEEEWSWARIARQWGVSANTPRSVVLGRNR